jgi:hypothetical protein
MTDVSRGIDPLKRDHGRETDRVKGDFFPYQWPQAGERSVV